MPKSVDEHCSICGCQLHRGSDYAKPTLLGRSHATEHHYIPERFFGRSKNRPKTQREGIFTACPWNAEGETALFCYECHEELIHNPVFLPEDIEAFADLVRARGLSEASKPEGREQIGERIKLFHEVIREGLNALSGAKKAGEEP